MKKKDLKEIKVKQVKDLEKVLKEKKETLGKVFVEMKTAKEKNLKKAKGLRRDIAQILTIIKEKSLIENMQDKSEKGKEATKK